jgi:ElaA protein
MSTLNWEVKTFHQLAGSQLFDVLQLRVNVFVVEQQCAYPELDEKDRYAETRHLIGCHERGQLIAYARILPPGLSFPEVGIGRLVVKKEARRQGFGHELLRTALENIHYVWPGRAVRLAAQEYLQGFYEHHGFARMSNRYLEDGIPHIDMVKNPC